MKNRAPTQDVIHEIAAKRSAWRDVRIEDFDPRSSSPDRARAAPTQMSEAERAAWQRRERDLVDALAAGVLRARAIEVPADQARATVALVEQAVAAGLALMALDERSAVELARLVVRHADALPDFDAAWCAVSWLSLGKSPAVADLICEVSEAGQGELSDAIVFALDPCDLHRDHPRLGARLAQLARPASSFVTRLVALGWLSDGRWPDAIRVQRAALREPYVALRQAALAGLLEHGGLTAADVLWLLEDAVRHPTPSRTIDDVVYSYEEVLTEAVARVAPHGGAAPLLRILCGDCAPLEGGVRATVDYAWALAALAAGYPAAARPHVDAALAHPDSWRRHEGVLAASQMPTDDALPRLRRLVSDPAPQVAELARMSWEAIAKRAVVVDELEGLPLDLLDAPPSDVLRSRLLVLRGDADAPRLAMLEALLAAAPHPEALVLLAYALGDSSAVHPEGRPALPVGMAAWTAAIVERFGERGRRAMTWLAERWPRPPFVAAREHDTAVYADAGTYWRDPTPET